MPKKIEYKDVSIRKRGRPKKPKEESENPADFSMHPNNFRGKYNKWDNSKIEQLRTRGEMITFLSSLGASQADCARMLGIAQKNVSAHYRDCYYKGKDDLKMRIRTAQLAKALDGDSNLLKHLGIVHCEEQKEAAATELTKDDLKGIIEVLANGGPQLEAINEDETGA